MYKYNCRKCPIRNRCIDESANAPSVKEIIRRAFAARTDTLETWGSLQPNCLLIKAEEERARTAPRESMLSRRLRQAREAREEASRALSASVSLRRDYLQPVASFPPLEMPSPVKPFPEDAQLSTTHPQVSSRQFPSDRDQAAPRWLTVKSSGRHIALPPNKELVLGRFDPNFGIPPDIDLSHEDQEARTVSRQHARIAGVTGHHAIEDMGSRHGLFVNGEQVRPGPPRQLRPGDRIQLGGVELLYEIMPGHLLELSHSGSLRHFLIVTPTGRRLSILPPNEIVIGRSDRFVNFVPDVDLSREGDVAVRVSRRHAIITWRDRIPYLEDLGSGFGTRLNGETLFIGQATPLKPGDHIWLGGCVLAYDVAL
jgi:pSer/pThr/pTyr-binding forkhead associated (FHA) protein